MRLKAPDNKAGRKSKCPKCGAAIVVPGSPLQQAPSSQESDWVVPETDIVPLIERKKQKPQPTKPGISDPAPLTPTPAKTLSEPIIPTPAKASADSLQPKPPFTSAIPVNQKEQQSPIPKQEFPIPTRVEVPPEPVKQATPLLVIHCGSCGKTSMNDPSNAGRSIMCPHCRWQILLPGTSVPPPASKPPPAPTAIQAVAPIQATRLTEEDAKKSRKEDQNGLRKLVPCPDCQSMVSVRANSCPKCGCPLLALVPAKDPAQHPSHVAHSMGIASLVVGVLSFFICWLPFIGASVSGLGMLLGLVGVTVACARHGSGLGFSVAGFCLSALTLFLNVSLTSSLMGYSPRVQEQKSHVKALIEESKAKQKTIAEEQEEANKRAEELGKTILKSRIRTEIERVWSETEMEVNQVKLELLIKKSKGADPARVAEAIEAAEHLRELNNQQRKEYLELLNDPNRWDEAVKKFSIK